jgi:hypothetical protein
MRDQQKWHGEMHEQPGARHPVEPECAPPEDESQQENAARVCPVSGDGVRAITVSRAIEAAGANNSRPRPSR